MPGIWEEACKRDWKMRKGGNGMPVIRKIGKDECSGCDRESYCYFGVAFKSFPTLKRVVFDEKGFTSCWKSDKNRT
jgi:hypothetical protein